uniref:Uncharacterized protein n=1 Tax=Hirsutella thompsonii TaxID=42368 RepID=A0A3G2ZP83_HIRTH|nr:hypothetical protein [Hirsutella thompsonii]
MANRYQNPRADYRQIAHEDRPDIRLFYASAQFPPPKNSFESSQEIIEHLKILLRSHMKDLAVAQGNNGIKVDAYLKSWKESDNWDLLKGKREVVVEFRLDFKSVISYT